MNNKPTPKQVAAAREVLRNAGYYVENLWHVDDVLGRFVTDKDTAINILDDVLLSDYITERVFDGIADIATDKDLKEV